FVYILYSKSTDRFYVGQTVDLEKRLEEHNQNTFSKAHTKNVNDWEIFFSIECSSRNQAIKIESHIKSTRKRKYYQDLKKYPEISQKLIQKYSS
ncbi:GIY-YIG nuclease family protein, partial [Algoriphagus boseongensis]|uniref:GIY-YIG nuclease family protein n=1 Tax=Algoriphagus boseongensis TaxID=1442587 RepID=UPI00105C56EF